MDFLFNAPVYRSLISPLLLLGMPRNFAIFMLTLMVVSTFVWGQIWLSSVLIAICIFANYLAKDDPYFFDIFKVVLKMPKVYC